MHFGAVMASDLVILGDTPDAWSAAIEAAALGLRCSVIRPDFDSGVSSGLNSVIATFGPGGPFAHDVVRGKTPCELWRDAVALQERSVSQLVRNVDVRIFRGPARLSGTTCAEVFVSGASRRVEGDLLLIATGTTQRKGRSFGVDGSRCVVPEDVCMLRETPDRLAVLGGSMTAIAFAHLFACAGSKVTLIDPEIALSQSTGVSTIASTVVGVQKNAGGVSIECANGEMLAVDVVLCAEKRNGATTALGLSTAELEADDEGRLWCDDRGFTWQPTIAAAGEVVGFPREFARDREAARRIVASQFPNRIAGRIDLPDRMLPMPRRRSIAKMRRVATAPVLKLYNVDADD